LERIIDLHREINKELFPRELAFFERKREFILERAAQIKFGKQPLGLHSLNLENSTSSYFSPSKDLDIN